jgi:exopolysaccharide biosynthesis polyprenyl glycosylphosphotransferase
MPRVQGLVSAVLESERSVEESRPPAPFAASALLRATAELSDRDVRSKRPPQLSFLLRLDTFRRLARVVILLAVDFVGVFLAIFTALCLKAEVRTGLDVGSVFHQTKDTVSFAYLVTVLLFARSSLYSDRALRPGLTRILASLFQVAGVSLIFAVVNGRTFSSFYIFYGSLLFALIYVSSFRYVYEAVSGFLLRAAGYRRRTVVVGTGPHIDAVARALSVGPHSPVDVVGFVSLRPRPDNGLRSLGTLDGIGQVIADHRIDEVIIADSDFPQLETVELIDQCHQRGVRVRIAPSTMEVLIHRAEFVPGQTVPLFELKPPVFEGVDFLVKRTFDIVVATLLLVVLSPLLLIILVAVRLTSRGPILYRSIRPGIGGVPFACMKFRTMHDDADQRQADLESLNEQSGALFKIRDDPRLTRVGKHLRRFSLDELPQLLNVVRGEMSLVGPRPLPQRDFEQLEPWHMKRYLVLPGITGLWQVSGRANLGFDDLVRLDFLYLERWSVFLDLTILVKTVPAVFTRRGAF